ncbi:Phosphate regulon sensor protein PhoR (SphS) [hydrothermal vent metagenome]|uniref:histidine kinase n=1 Tax=hydrothermal vent metagenome TaxID=652676 RepID=A0A3B1DW16_9ZZZZ
MNKKRLFWQLFLTYLLITLTALTAVGWYSLNSLSEFHYDRIAIDLEARARLVERLVLKRLTLKNSSSENIQSLNILSKEVGESTSMRVTLIDKAGNVLADSHEDPARMDNHANRPEIKKALSGKIGTSSRHSLTVKEQLFYLALPVLQKGEVLGVVRTSIPVTFIDNALNSIETRIAWAGFAIALLAGWVSLVVSRRISKPLENMKRAAEEFSHGDLTRKISATDSFEISGLAEALNKMARQLDWRIRCVTEERNEREAILFSMIEGVFAIDAAERFISMNQAAAKLLGADPETSRRKHIQEVVRNSELQTFVKKALYSSDVVEADIVMRGAQERNLQARGTVLKDASGNNIGAVIVLNDVTLLRRLENMRSDFVSNVSHEIKTPITSIKGFVETLLAGAIHDPKDASRFLEIIARQVDRLNAIIDDLLSLSRLEHDSDRFTIAMEPTRLQEVLQSSIQACQVRAAKHAATIELNCDDDLKANINPQLLEQAIINLVDNAIKFSGSDKRVAVSAKLAVDTIIIQVRNFGPGIDKEHLPRLFERFYRVDKSRSRDQGGTGLGLAIVKHIAQVHKGSVRANSELGKGSVFSIHLPAK